MSADNGIYILPLTDGFYVTHAQAIENIQYEPDLDYNSEMLVGYFGNARIFETEDEAYIEAKKLYNKEINDGGIVEYGISKLLTGQYSMKEYKEAAEILVENNPVEQYDMDEEF